MQHVVTTDLYIEKYVAFIDILGFKAKVEKADNDIFARSQLFEILKIFKESLCEDPFVDMRFTQFSDCIIVSAALNQQGLWGIVQSIIRLTCNLLQYDIFVRGGLDVGGIHHDAKFVYGIGVNRAYKLENKIAEFPMTCVSGSVVLDCEKYGISFTQNLLKDVNGRWFIHYLKEYADYNPDEIYPGKVCLEMPAQRIITFVSNRLTFDTGAVLEKDKWFQHYWNTEIAKNGCFSQIEAEKIEQNFDSIPTIIFRRQLSQ
jgi:hypothetical protein